MNKRQIPTFATEADEADWWFEHADDLADDMAKAAEEGQLGRGTTMKRAIALNNLVQLEPRDMALARDQAAQRGLDYQTYIQSLLHEALLREAKAS